MAISRQRKNVAYGIGSPLQDISPQPIVSTRVPTTSDKAEIGTIWTNKSTNAAWVLASIASNSATWTPMTVNAGATVTTGNLTVSAGDVNVIAGDIVATAGSIEAGAGLVATTGGLLVSAGDVDVTLGDLTVAAGDLDVDVGDLDVVDGFIHCENDITTDSGDIVSVTGDILGRSLFAGGDEGTGAATTTTFTNGTDVTLSTGAGVVLMKTTNPGNSSGWMKIYVGTDVRWIPFWTNLSP